MNYLTPKEKYYIRMLSKLLIYREVLMALAKVIAVFAMLELLRIVAVATLN